MKKLLQYLVTFLFIFLSLPLLAEAKWQKLPDAFLSDYEARLVDDKYETYVNLKNGDSAFYLTETADVYLHSLQVATQGQVNLIISNGYSIHIEASYNSRLPELNQIDLRGYPAEDYENLEFIFQAPAKKAKRSRVLEVSLFGIFDPVLTETEVPAEDNLVTLETAVNELEKTYGVELTFSGEEVAGLLKYQCGKYHSQFPVAMDKDDEKILTFDILPFASYQTAVFQFEPVKGQLEKGVFEYKYTDKAIDLAYVKDMTRAGEVFNAPNLLDNDLTTQISGEWGSDQDRKVEIKLAQPLYWADLVFYYLPGYSKRITFEALYVNNKREIIGEMNDQSYGYENSKITAKADYEYLKNPGYKLFQINKRKKPYLIKSVILHLHSEGSAAGGITDIKAYGSTYFGRTSKLFIPRGAGFVNTKTRFYLLDLTSHGYSDLFNFWHFNLYYWINKLNRFFKSKFHGHDDDDDDDDYFENCTDPDKTGKYGFYTKIDDPFAFIRFRKRNYTYYYPVVQPEKSEITLDLPENRVYTTRQITIHGESAYRASHIRMNGEKVESAKRWSKEFWQDFDFSRDGMYYIETAVLSDRDRNRVDTIYIDTTAPVIELVYPETSYVNQTITSITGIMQDLTPLKVLINETEATLWGHYFYLDNVVLDPNEENKYIIQAYDQAGLVTTKEITLVVDQNPPVLSILAPIDGYFTKERKIDLQVEAFDEAPMTIYTCGRQIRAETSGIYDITGISLAEGRNSIEVLLADAAGNSVKEQVTVFLDNEGPQFTSTLKTEYTNQEVFQYAFTVKDFIGTQVFWGKTPDAVTQPAVLISTIELADGYREYTYQIEINSTQDQAQQIYLQAFDDLGNESATSFVLVNDMTPPVLTVEEPEEQLVTRELQVDVKGTYAEAYLKTITVNGLTAHIKEKKSSFRYHDFPLAAEGDNLIEVTAEDLAGNITTITRTVNRDTTPPADPNVHAATTNLDENYVYWNIHDESADLDYYQIRRVPRFKEQRIRTVETNEYLDSDFDPEDNIEQFFYYYIRAVDQAGNKSAWSGASTGKNAQYQPGQPGSMDFEKMTLTWDGDEADQEEYLSVSYIENPLNKDSSQFYTPVYEFGPADTYFAEAMEISFPFDQNIYTEENAAWFYYQKTTDTWHRIPTWYDTETGTLKGEIYHFSSYAVKQDVATGFHASELSTLSSSKDDINIMVNDSSGSATLLENEATLIGPGGSSFTLTRTLNSTELANRVKYPNKLTGSQLQVEKNLRIAGWNTNIPVIRGNNIQLESGTLTIDYLELNRTKVFHYNGIHKVYCEKINTDGLRILVETLAGKTYRFDLAKQYFQIKRYEYNQRTDPQKNITKIYFNNFLIVPIKSITYPDGNVLNFSLQNEDSLIYWNNDQTNAIEFDDTHCVNLVTGDTVTYEKGPILSKAVYSNSRHTETYQINYDYPGFFNLTDVRNRRGHWDEQLKFIVDIPGAKKKTLIIDAKDQGVHYTVYRYGNRGQRIYNGAYLKEEYLLNSIITDKNNQPVKKRVYDFGSKVKVPHKVFRKSEVKTYAYQNNGWEETPIDTVRKSFNRYGKMTSVNSDQVRQNYQYLDSNGYAVFKAEYVPDTDKIKVTLDKANLHPVDGLTISRSGQINISYVKDGQKAKSIIKIRPTKVTVKKNIAGSQVEEPGIQLSYNIMTKKGSEDDWVRSYEGFAEASYSIRRSRLSKISFTNTIHRIQANEDFYKLFEVPDTIAVYASTVTSRNNIELVFTVINEKENYSYIKKSTFQKKDINGRLTDPVWTEYTYDDWGRNTATYNNQGIYHKIAYLHAQDSESLINEMTKIAKIENGSFSDKAAGFKESNLVKETEVFYTYASSFPVSILGKSFDYLLLDSKDIVSTRGLQKFETYAYDSNAHYRLQNIKAYQADQQTQINQIHYQYDYNKRDFPLTRMAITDPAGTELYFREYQYQEGSQLLEQIKADNLFQVDMEYDHLNRTNRITYANGSVVQNDFNDTGNWYAQTLKASAGEADFIQKKSVQYFDHKSDSIDYYQSADQTIVQNYQYDALGRVIESTDFKGNPYRYEYSKGFLNKIINPYGAEDIYTGQKTLDYQGSTIETSAIDGKEAQTGILTEITDEEGRKVRTLTNTYGQVLARYIEINGLLKGIYYQFDEKNRLAAVHTDIVFDLQADSDTITLTKGNRSMTTQYTYDDFDRIVKTESLNVEVDNSGLKTLATDFWYNELDFLTMQTDVYEQGKTPQRYFIYQYDGAGNQTAVIESLDQNIDAGDYRTDISYDKNSNPILIKYPEYTTGQGTAHRITEKYIYNNMNQAVQKIVNHALATRKAVIYEYDPAGRIYKTYDQRAGNYNSSSQMYVLKADKDQYATTYEYDKLGRLVTITYPNGLKETAQYDANGNLIKAVNTQGAIAENFYDKLNRLIFNRTGKAGEGFSAGYYTYYHNSQLKQRGLSKPVYDQYESTIHQASLSEAEVMDMIHTLSAVKLNSINYEYNSFGQVDRIVDAYHGVNQFSYNNQGQLDSALTKSGAEETYQYFRSGLVKEQQTKIGGEVLQSTDYIYDIKGNLLEYYTGNGSDRHLEKQFAYNSRDLVEQITDAYNNQTLYQYNELAQPTQVTFPDGRTEDYNYNTDLQLSQRAVTVNIGSQIKPAQLTQDFTYHQQSGSLTQINRTENSNGSISNLTENYAYDFTGTLFKYDINLNGNTFDAENKYDYQSGNNFLKYPGKTAYLQYQRDSQGRVTTIGNSQSDFLYDFAYENSQLKSITTLTGEATGFDYDKMGRITNIDSKIGAKSLFSLANIYDVAKTDNLIKQTVTTDQGTKTFSYEYDEANRLTGYEFDNIRAYINTAFNEISRSLYRDSYPELNENTLTNRPWLNATKEIEQPAETPDSVNYTEPDNIHYDKDAASIVIDYNEVQNNIKVITISKADNTTELKKSHFSLYYDETTTSDEMSKILLTEYELINKDQQCIVVLNNPINAKKIMIHFNKDEIDPLGYLNIGEYTDGRKFIKELPLNREQAGYEADRTSGDIKGRLSDVVKVYSLAVKLKDDYQYDSSNRRTQIGQFNTNNQTIKFEDKGIQTNRIKKQGDKTIRYDKSGRRIVISNRKGTYLYRYNLDTKLSKIYYSYKRFDPDV
ncbi:MAG: hypothetical protein MJB14_20995, partial [Spirochaetes bacterium]|nr:hypothetical protein [Spirochaetota bacterium]